MSSTAVVGQKLLEKKKLFLFLYLRPVSRNFKESCCSCSFCV